MRSFVAWSIALPFVAWAVARWLGLERGYPATALMAFTPYVVAAGAVAALVVAGLRRPLAALACLAATVALGAAVAPRASGDEAAAERPLRVLTANVHAGATPPELLAALVREHRVDVLSVQELTPEQDAVLRRALPHRAARPAPGPYGIGVYARFPIDLRPARRARGETAVARGRLPGGGRLEITAVHPPAPTSDSNVRALERELAALPAARGGWGARILAGDFNSTLDHRALRELLDRGYVDAAEQAGAGLRPTWPARRRLPAVTIDHILVDARCRVASARVLGLPGSDHRAVLATIDLAGCAGRR